MAIIKCKMCGGDLMIEANSTVAECEYCGSRQTLPKLTDDKKASLYDRANHFRRNNEFDKAMSIYEKILNEDNSDSESYWSLVLCRYGVEYVEDPTTHKRVPTVNRAQFTSIYDDEDYKSAIQYADIAQKSIYEDEAKAINDIQKEILAISQKEEPFDVFICYKETDSNGRRTPDSVLATELYHELTREGLKVFFSRITLEDKLGTAYEPYIFAALNSAKAMVVVGTKPEYFNAVWVKNEWSRYLSLIKNGANKILIPAYRDMNPYDLPEEFSHLQAQDMSKLGFMQDLVRCIKKIVVPNEPNLNLKNITIPKITNGNVDVLLKRAHIFLEDGDWKSADEYCEKVLDINPENGEAYLLKLLCKYKIMQVTEISNKHDEFIWEDSIVNKIFKYSTEETQTAVREMLELAKKKRLLRYFIDEQHKKDMVEYNQKYGDKYSIGDLEQKLGEKKNEKISKAMGCLGAIVVLWDIIMLWICSFGIEEGEPAGVVTALIFALIPSLIVFLPMLNKYNLKWKEIDELSNQIEKIKNYPEFIPSAEIKALEAMNPEDIDLNQDNEEILRKLGLERH